MLEVEWELGGGKASRTHELLQGPQLKESAHLPSQYAPNSFRAQWVVSSWVISIVRSQFPKSRMPLRNALSPRTETRNLTHPSLIRWLHLGILVTFKLDSCLLKKKKDKEKGNKTTKPRQLCLWRKTYCEEYSFV